MKIQKNLMAIAIAVAIIISIVELVWFNDSIKNFKATNIEIAATSASLHPQLALVDSTILAAEVSAATTTASPCPIPRPGDVGYTVPREEDGGIMGEPTSGIPPIPDSPTPDSRDIHIPTKK